jgi:hypothetical protein
MTLHECIQAFKKFFDQDVTIDGGQIVFNFENHLWALEDLRNARNALAMMEKVNGD